MLHNRPVLKTRRKELRNNCTPAEHALWCLLQQSNLGDYVSSISDRGMTGGVVFSGIKYFCGKKAHLVFQRTHYPSVKDVESIRQMTIRVKVR